MSNNEKNNQIKDYTSGLERNKDVYKVWFGDKSKLASPANETQLNLINLQVGQGLGV